MRCRIVDLIELGFTNLMGGYVSWICVQGEFREVSQQERSSILLQRYKLHDNNKKGNRKSFPQPI